MTSNIKRSTFLALAITAAALAGCASNGTKPMNGPASASSTTGTGINTSGLNNGQVGNGQALGSNASGNASRYDLSKHSIYFAFNKATIQPQYQSIIDNWSKYLMVNPSVRVQLQGNTDERGSRAYNLALGENRANAVAQAMEGEGVNSSQISVVSYGEERPVCTEHDEACWQQNRRTDIVQQ